MRGIYIGEVSAKRLPTIDVFAERSGLILEWVVMKGRHLEQFHLRQIVAETGVSIGLAQKVLAELVLRGLVISRGVRTGKSYSLGGGTEPMSKFLNVWGIAYRLHNKCKSFTYSCGLQGWDEIVRTLAKSKHRDQVSLALHSAVRAHGYRFANLEGVELYLLDPGVRPAVEKLLRLEPKERGYEVLLVEPYYKSMVRRESDLPELAWTKDGLEGLRSSPPLLTWLDLRNFPLRGQEQADYLRQNESSLKGLVVPVEKRR